MEDWEAEQRPVGWSKGPCPRGSSSHTEGLALGSTPRGFRSGPDALLVKLWP